VKTAVDTSVLFKLFLQEAGHQDWLDLLIEAREEGRLVICDVVFAELSAAFPTQAELEDKLSLLGIVYEPILPTASHLAGKIFRRYRDSGGPRGRIIPDFLIGAHASTQANRLASIDNGFFRQYFKKLAVVAPRR
jgi:predicted nucleic acid-binding protein